jgi:hypothetical protein
MATREEILNHLWTNRINAYMQEDWIDKEIEMSQRHPDAPFADVGPIITRLLEIGATRRELSLLLRVGEYNGIFDAFFTLEGSPEVSKDIRGIHEELLSSDPSGMEGRPGSAPAKD